MALSNYAVLMMALMIIASSITSIHDKFQNQQYVNQGGHQKYFYHPFMQSFMGYFAISLIFPIYLIDKKMRPQIYRQRKEKAISEGFDTNFNPLRVVISAFCYTLTIICQEFALNYIPASIYQMFGGGVIAITLFFSVVFLKMKADKNQVLGVILSILGVSIVGFTPIFYSSSDDINADTGLQIAAYIILILSLFLNGFYLTYQQSILRKYYVEPIELTGYVGMFGFIFNVIIVSVITFIPCPFDQGACVFDSQGNQFIERPQMYFIQVWQNKTLFFLLFLQLISIVTYMFTGVSITKNASALARSICDVSPTIIIWIICIIITETAGKMEQNYVWEFTDIGAIFLQLGGFVVIILGNLIYNQIYLPFCFKKIPIKQQSNITLLNSEDNYKMQSLSTEK